MSAHTSIDNVCSEEDLSNEQIYALLQRAKSRAQEKSLSSKDSVQGLLSFPKLDLSDLPKPYVQSIGEIAHADPTRLVQKEDRDLSNRMRKVENPLAMKKQLLDVCHVVCFIHMFPIGSRSTLLSFLFSIINILNLKKSIILMPTF